MRKPRKDKAGIMLAAPMGLWVTLFFAVPLLIIVTYSFLKKGLYGGVEWEPSFDAYRQVLAPDFIAVTLRTLWISILATLTCLALALPTAYAIARSRHQTLFLFLTIIPFWTSSLIRIYAWINLLSTEGLVNNILLALGIINEPLHLIYNLFAVILVLVYMYLPFAILPLFTAFDRFDFTLVDAARDLGSSKLGALVRIMLPSVRSGITTALVFTAIPVFGAYTVPLLVGGMGSTMVGNIIVDQVQKTRNWPLASAFSVILTLVSLIGVLTVLRGGRKDKKSKEVRT